VFRRRSSRPPAEPAAASARERCTAAGCRRRDGIRCSYVDKRARACPTAWCPEHVVDVAGIAFCRRHASTMTAIEGSEIVAGLPDLDNRAPSLAGWIGRELDAPIRELFARIAPIPAATLVAEPVQLVLTPGGRSRRWAKTWKMIHRDEIVSRVSIEVDELDDCQVAARVDSKLIGRGVPPWIEHRLAGHRVEPTVDAAERRQFATAMARSIELVVTGQEVPQGP
jgi:hypothetical protein